MEVQQKSAAMLSNFEVLNLLNDVQKRHGGKPNKLHSNLATISYEITQFLENTACVKQSPETIEKFMRALDNFKLMKAEKLQLLNLRPKTAVEIQLIVEESEERLTEDQIYQLLDVISEHLPDTVEVAEEGEGGEEGEEDQMEEGQA